MAEEGFWWEISEEDFPARLGYHLPSVFLFS
jgi:hypothetical protein